MRVLRLDVAGLPREWLTTTEAALLYATDCVVWTLGDPFARLRGGVQRATGVQSRIDVHPIIATRGAAPNFVFGQTPSLSNRKLFARDRHICAYCGGHFHSDHLTRDHIVATSRGGHDTWMNCVTACRTCNGLKGSKLPEEAAMPLLYLPYVPNLHEDMILRERQILADQMEFLRASLPKHSRLHS